MENHISWYVLLKLDSDLLVLKCMPWLLFEWNILLNIYSLGRTVKCFLELNSYSSPTTSQMSRVIPRYLLILFMVHHPEVLSGLGFLSQWLCHAAGGPSAHLRVPGLSLGSSGSDTVSLDEQPWDAADNGSLALPLPAPCKTRMNFLASELF